MSTGPAHTPGSREYTIIVERGEDGWLIGTVASIPECHTQGRTLEELLERMREALDLFEEDDDEQAQLELVGVHRLAV